MWWIISANMFQTFPFSFSQVPNLDAALNEKEQLKCLSECIWNEISYCNFPGQASSLEGAKVANGKTNKQMSNCGRCCQRIRNKTGEKGEGKALVCPGTICRKQNVGKSWNEWGVESTAFFFFFFESQIIRLQGPRMLLLKRTDFKAFEKENRNFHLCCSGSSFRGVPTAAWLEGESLGLNCEGEEWMRLPDAPS